MRFDLTTMTKGGVGASFVGMECRLESSILTTFISKWELFRILLIGVFRLIIMKYISFFLFFIGDGRILSKEEKNIHSELLMCKRRYLVICCLQMI